MDSTNEKGEQLPNGVQGAGHAAGPDVPRATVVITACSIDRGLLETLRSIRTQVDEVGCEVLLVFNTSPEEIGSAACRSVGDYVDQIVFERRPGKSAALNTAVRAARGDVVVFTDDDAIPEPGWLAGMAAPLLEDPELAGVGGPVDPVLPAKGVPPWYLRLTRARLTSHLGPKHRLEEGMRAYRMPRGASICPVPLGANCAWRKSWLLRFPYRENLGPNRATGLRGGEDTCLAIEIMEAGGRVSYASDAVVRHPVHPARMTRKFVRDGARIQGREYARIMHALERPIPNPIRLMRHAAKGGRSGPVLWVESAYRAFKRDLRREFCRGVCDELGWRWERATRADARREAMKAQARAARSS